MCWDSGTLGQRRKKNNCNHSCVNSRIKTEKYESTNDINHQHSENLHEERRITKNKAQKRDLHTNHVPYALPLTPYHLQLMFFFSHSGNAVTMREILFQTIEVMKKNIFQRRKYYFDFRIGRNGQIHIQMISIGYVPYHCGITHPIFLSILQPPSFAVI